MKTYINHARKIGISIAKEIKDIIAKISGICSFDSVTKFRLIERRKKDDSMFLQVPTEIRFSLGVGLHIQTAGNNLRVMIATCK
jgi:hypothetical protein